MTNPSASIHRILAITIVLAVLLRLGSAWYQGDAVTDLPGIFDQLSYDGLARRVLAGHGFSFAEYHWPATRAGEPTAHWSYLYTLYLTGVYALFGLHPLAARAIQAVAVGILQTWLAWRLGKRIFGPITGLWAAAFSALYIYFFYYAGALITEGFYIVAILWSFDVALRIADWAPVQVAGGAKRSTPWLLWLELGLAIGVAALLRQLYLLFVPFLFVWLWWALTRPAADTGQREAAAERVSQLLDWKVLRGFVACVAVVAAMILPWTVRNYLAFGTFVPLNTNAGYAFFWANHPIYGTNFVGILPADGPSYGDLLPPELLHLNEAELDRALLQRGLGFVADDPVRYLLLSASRTREYFKFWPSAESGTISNIARVGSFGLFLPLILYGLFAAGLSAWRSHNRRFRSQVVLLYLFAVVYTAIHLLSWSLIRYRLPVDAVLLLFAAYGVFDLLSRLGVYRARDSDETQVELPQLHRL